MGDEAAITRVGFYEVLHEVVAHGNTLYLGGIVAEDLSGGMAGQTEDVMQQMQALLEGNGSSLDRILSATIFVTDLMLKPAMNEVWLRYLPAHAIPARATVGVADLGPGVLIEVTAIAARG
jgi:enamine deaminase RidA (YjgF/YER057c/UK114 family)